MFNQLLDNRQLQGAGVNSRYAAPDTSTQDTMPRTSEKPRPVFRKYRKKDVKKFWRARILNSSEAKKARQLYTRFGKGFRGIKIRQHALKFTGTGTQAKYLGLGSRAAPGKTSKPKPKISGFATVFSNSAAGSNSSITVPPIAASEPASAAAVGPVVDPISTVVATPAISSTRFKKKMPVAPKNGPIHVLDTPEHAFVDGSLLAVPATKLSGDICWVAIVVGNITTVDAQHQGASVKVLYAELDDDLHQDRTVYCVPEDSRWVKIPISKVICTLPCTMKLADTSSAVILDHVSTVLEVRQLQEMVELNQTNDYRKAYLSTASSRKTRGKRLSSTIDVEPLHSSKKELEASIDSDEGAFGCAGYDNEDDSS